MDVVAEGITVTHYINPHCFWYKPNAACMPENEQYEFSVKLNDKCEVLYGGQYILAQTVKGPNVAEIPGNVVAVYNTVQQYWNRCVVDEVIICIGNKRIYRLWALDEGIPIQSSPEYVRPLPEEFKTEPAHAKRGALMNIFPLEPRNYSMDDAPLRMGNQWYAGAVSMMETLLELALSVSMIERAQVVVHGELVHFGDMTIKSTDNQGCDVSQFLCENCPQQVDQRISDPMFFNRRDYGNLYFTAGNIARVSLSN
ncbi:uncharacterized protein LOC128268618 isoform X2 [Anopheles cruzii]|uniref:uncharacterized protein LOC128268618 isoform X2 n=1 Tax=Anopheles cruzii TaxID=68878 RepID=UPI0022EC36E8|nr:uncharacterized protein LOC128268618 isoform X2 [Anopheles cruzii]